MASMTFSITTVQGTMNKTVSIPDADIVKLNNAYTAFLIASGNASPSNSDIFNAMIATWIADTISFVRSASQQQAVTTAINSVAPIVIA